MPHLICKLNDTEELWGHDLKDVEVKALSDFELEIIGSTEAMDRDQEVLTADGWDLKNFKKNPVVLPAHNYGEPPVARAKSVKIVDGKLTFKIEFPEEGVNPVSDIYRKLYKSGFMNAASVGFIPRDYKYGNDKNEPYRTFLKQELLELSLVSVPANPEALVTAKGIKDAIDEGVISEQDIAVLKQAIEAAVQGDDSKEGARKKDAGQQATEIQEPEKQVTLKALMESDPQFATDLKQLIKDQANELIESIDLEQKVLDILQDVREKGLYKDILFGTPGEEHPDGDSLKGEDIVAACKEGVKEALLKKEE